MRKKASKVDVVQVTQSEPQLDSGEMARFVEAGHHVEIKKLQIRVQQGKIQEQELLAKNAELVADSHRRQHSTLSQELDTYMTTHRAWVDELKTKYKIDGQFAYDPLTGRIIA